MDKLKMLKTVEWRLPDGSYKTFVKDREYVNVDEVTSLELVTANLAELEKSQPKPRKTRAKK